MENIAIRVSDLSKLYQIGTKKGQTLAESVKGIFSKSKSSKEDFWALRDLTFDIKKGDTVAIIGKNGAGKSTLLKILSRITYPTKGKIEINGRLSSLLEVGTGFHPELSGRENIFLNGTILGMKREEVRRKLDEIISFSGVEKFLDTPVKNYSSGMYVRLAFAVAANLDPEILIIDEVLAVGDQEFQNKCLGKMEEVSRSYGRTILFVSHNLGAVANLCKSGIVLQEGSIVKTGPINDCIHYYTKEVQGKPFSNGVKNLKSPSITNIELDDKLLSEGDILLKVHFSSPFELNPPIVGMLITNSQGNPVFGSNARIYPYVNEQKAMREGYAAIHIKKPQLNSGKYSISIWLADKKQDFEVQRDILSFDFISQNGTGLILDPKYYGSVNFNSSWYLKSPDENLLNLN